MPRKIWAMPLLVIALCTFTDRNCEAQWISYETKVLAENLNVPWEIEWGYDNWIWFTERSGRFTKINPETGEKKILLKVPHADHSNAEKGTLGFAFHPDFPTSPYLYIAYNYKTSEKEAFNVVRWTYQADTLIDPLVMIDGLPSGYIHNGSRVKVGPDRKLYISTGEADSGALAQNLSSLSGKILRMELDGSVPKDNPFQGSLIWSYGHRNPQGLEFSKSGKLYSTEHGPASDDEFNLIKAGANYGWPLVEGFCDRENEQRACDSLHVEEPLMNWTPTVAVTGLQYCDQPKFPEWRNSMIMATLKDQSLWVLKLSEEGDRVVANYRYPLLYTEDSSEVRRLRDYCFSPDGRLFVSTSNIWSADWNPDRIIEIKRKDIIPFEVRKISPLNGDSLPQQEVTLMWQQDAGDSRYQIQVSTDRSMASSFIDEEVSDTALTVSNLANESVYYWRVRELTSSGPWSAIDSFAIGLPSHVRQTISRQVKAYPNPTTSGVIRLDLTETFYGGSLVSAEGKIIRSLTKDELGTKEIDLHELPSGLYFASLSLDHRRTYLIPLHVVR